MPVGWQGDNLIALLRDQDKSNRRYLKATLIVAGLTLVVSIAALIVALVR